MDFVSRRHLIHVSPESCVSHSQALSPLTSPDISVHPSVTNFSIIEILVVGMMGTSFMLMASYIFVIKCCLNWNRVDTVRVRRFSLSRQYEEPSSEHRGLDEAVIQSIPVIHYKMSEEEEEEEEARDFGERSSFCCECAFCLNEFQQGEKLRVIPNCNHVFHIDCVDVWLQNNANCPLCRRHISLVTSQSQSQIQVDQLLTPRPSPENQSQNVESFIGDGGEDMVVIDLDLDNQHDGGGLNLQGTQERGKEELEVPTGPNNPISPSSHRKLEQKIVQKKARKLHKVTSMGDECIDINRDQDGCLLVQPIRRSFSMDSSMDRQFYVAVQQALHQQHGHVHEASSIEVYGDSSGRANKRSFFSFGHGSRTRSAVLPVYLDP